MSTPEGVNGIFFGAFFVYIIDNDSWEIAAIH